MSSIVSKAENDADYSAASHQIDCARLGLWRRLDSGDRCLPPAALERLANRPKAATAAAWRERQPELWITDGDVSDLLGGVLLLRLASATVRRASDLEELASEGLTLAFLVPRVSCWQPTGGLHRAR